MQLLYRIAADATVVLHAGYATFVVVGLLAILVGIVRRWNWVRNFMFRSIHLLAILIVVAEEMYDITCPLTTWEKYFRSRAGETLYQGNFIANWVHNLLFIEAEPWAFTLCYSVFGVVVLLTFCLAPPRWPSK
jgi:hypothetical protein